MYAFGVGMGIMLLAAKYGSFWLLTGGNKQIRLPFTGEEIRKWVYRSHVRTGLLDIIAGYFGMHVLVAFGGSILAMIAMTTYIVTCMSIIFLSILYGLAKEWFTSNSRPKHLGRPYAQRYS